MIEEKQRKLKLLYEKRFLNLNNDLQYSSPHLMSLDIKNITTDIMFIGQETNEWYGNWQDFNNRGINEQMNIYKQFMQEYYYKINNLFFKYIREIMNDTNKIPMWTNVFKFDLGDKRKVKNILYASKEEQKKILKIHIGLLAEEIAIVQPKIIIFFTGTQYDKLFIDPIIKQNGDYKKLYLPIHELSVDEWKCCKLDIKKFQGFQNFNGTAFRTYHPMYLNRNMKSLGTEIITYLKEQV